MEVNESGAGLYSDPAPTCIIHYMPVSRKLRVFLWVIFSVIVCSVLFFAIVEFVHPFTPDGTEAGIAAIEKFEETRAGCDGAVIVISTRRLIKGRSEGSWVEAWKIRNACDETHEFLLRFGISPEGKAFVIKFELNE